MRYLAKIGRNVADVCGNGGAGVGTLFVAMVQYGLGDYSALGAVRKPEPTRLAGGWGKAYLRMAGAGFAWTPRARGITIVGNGSGRLTADRSHPRCKSPLSDHVERRIRSPPRSFGLFAAEGFDQDRQARRIGQGRPPAGAGADRHRQHVRGAGISPTRWRATASSRSSAARLAIDFGDQDPNARNALASAPSRIVLLAARERGYRNLMRLNSRAFLETPVHQSPHHQVRMAGGDAEDLIALTGGPDGPISLALARRSCRAARPPAATGWRACSAIASMSNCSATASTSERRTESRPDRSRLCERAAAGCDQRALFRAATTITRRMMRCFCIAGGRLIAETDREQLTPDHRFKTARRNGGSVRRHSGGAGVDWSRSPSAARSGR